MMYFFIIGLISFSAGLSQACVGRTLYVGSLNSPQDKVMSEMLALLINERTGTTVQVRYFDNNESLYKATKSEKEEKRVDIIVEDTIDALKLLNKTPGANPEKDYLTVKKAYEKTLDIIWLDPFGYDNSKGAEHKSVSAPLIRRNVLINFPLLPRVLNKLSGAISAKAYTSLNKKVAKGDKPKNVAKAFLKKKKLI
jgi:glycine betaine/choline ABC-type transport system substrate-binding protein